MLFRSAVLLFLGVLSLAFGDSCTSADGLDLASYNNNMQKYVYDTQGGAFVLVSLCGHINVTCGGAQDGIKCAQTATGCCAFCQNYPIDGGQMVGVCLGGDYVSFNVIEGGIKMKYLNGDAVQPGDKVKGGPREVFVDVKCKAGVQFEASSFVQASSPQSDGSYAYNLTVHTSAACGGAGGGLGGGAYFLIIILGVVLPVYLFGGIAWNKFKEGKEGVEVMPNYEFWAASPGYFLAGCIFTKDKVLGLCGRSGYDTVS